MFIGALFTIAKTWKVSVDGCTNKENVIHTHTGILYSLKKEGNPAICNNMDKIRRHIARQRQILPGMTYMWNHKKKQKKIK